jgi:uncharacterized protein (DUF934 family)
MVLVKAGAVIADPWRHLADEETLPEAGPVTVSWERWVKERDAIGREQGELGVRVPNIVAGSEIGADAGRFGLIVLVFPNFSDGRAYSQARILRSRFGFSGELRATGGVLRDQLQFMQRCGFDTFEVSDRAIEENWFAALGEFDLFYQPAADNRPWIARQRQGLDPAR